MLNSFWYFKTSVVIAVLDFIYFQNFKVDKTFPKQKRVTLVPIDNKVAKVLLQIRQWCL